METRVAYCATCDRPVRVLVRREALAWPSPEQLDSTDIVCLEYGETCTGSMCPLFDVPSAQMKKNLDEFRKSKSEPETR